MIKFFCSIAATRTNRCIAERVADANSNIDFTDCWRMIRLTGVEAFLVTGLNSRVVVYVDVTICHSNSELRHDLHEF